MYTVRRRNRPVENTARSIFLPNIIIAASPVAAQAEWKDAEVIGDSDGRRFLSQDEVSDILRSSRSFADFSFPQDLVLDEVDFTQCTFDNCAFHVPIIRQADFSEAMLKNCTFAPTRFVNCKFADASLSNCVLFDAGLRKGCVFAFCKMQAVELINCNCSSNEFERCDLYSMSANGSRFQGAKFDGSKFERAMSRKIVRAFAKFDRCNLTFADLSRLNLESCEFLGCKFSETLFFDTNLTKAIFTDSILDRAEWERANLTKANLAGASITGLNLSVLTNYAGMIVSESETKGIVEELGIVVIGG